MSDSQTNENIVDNITKDLEDHLRTDCQSNSGAQNNPESENTKEDDYDNSDDSLKDEKQDISEKLEDEDDFVDEDKLKELEKSFSEEETEERRKQALELKKRGNEEYKEQQYLEAVVTYTEALKLCPTKYTTERSIVYANRAACKIHIGRKKSAIEDCSRSLEINDKYVRAYIRRAKLYEEDDKLDESLEDFKKVLELDPGCTEALSAHQRLPPKIAEKNEKLKEEMLGKLKDLGNLFLRPLGLSTDNFKLEQNSATGGYSVSFNQNKGGDT